MATANKKVPKPKAPPAAGPTTQKAQEKIVLSEEDKVLHDMVIAPSKEINAITSMLVIRDTEYIIEYFKQRINLEQKYLEELTVMTKNVQIYCAPDEYNIVQKSFMNYVGLTDEIKPLRLQYIEKLKEQCDQLIKFRNEQQKAYDKNKAWMNHSNNEYIIARLKKLPIARENYNQKWDEIEKSTGGTVASPMVATTPLTTSLSLTTTREESDFRPLSLDEDRKNIKPVDTSQSSRIERFMKRHLNRPEDINRQNIKVANLKVEVAEADTNYRNVVREISTLAIKIDATNHHILNNVQTALKEKADKIKHMLQVALQADIHQLQSRQEPSRRLLASIDKLDTESQAKIFNSSSTNALNRFPKPPPIYYTNYHVGVCKDLIFGTSLTEYAQQKHRSPPLLITKCLDALERLGGLEREGIYRVSGKQSNLEKIKHAFEIDEEAVVIGQNDIPEDVFSIASVVKIFLRELKSPLFPFKLTDRLVYSQIPDQELRLMNLLTRLLKLQPANYDTLKALVCHLYKLQSCVEKNKMTINNLTLIFTPAIFQDLNHAQNSPGEWAKDCVLEDLILNYNNIFANKDLHNNSAITGDIEYGFKETSNHQDRASRYAMTVQSPDSPTGISHEESESEYTFVTEETVSEQSSLIVVEEQPRSVSPAEMDGIVHEVPNSDNHNRSNSDRKRYQKHFQEKGLRVNTASSVSTAPTKDKSELYKSSHQITTVKSATVPSYDWLKLDPENSPNVPEVPKLRRSATTGRKVMSRRKMSARYQDEDVPQVPLLTRKSEERLNIHAAIKTIP